ncbi:MAG: 16S rRNA (adenine(1518)-N(6)/adenine(1519)-N(6))-dimethyltransferase RsmA [Bacteroidales bacterium]|nr:16S rRNA (adenine(1518)-N(6)/adenine(1519)-N(6))-dimethyltransferase RsmA [Candidatus Latescibacterota bacterium]
MSGRKPDNTGSRPRAKKSLGQNFLISGKVIDRIVKALDPGSGIPIMEIGPGTGALTGPLAEKGARIAAFELDRRLSKELGERFAGSDNVEIVEADVREIDFDLEAKRREWEKYRVAGNIPYLLTSTIMIKLGLLERSAGAVIMVQKEVGERILTSPGKRGCGILSVFLQAWFDISMVTTARAGAFIPKPKVDSVVLSFTPEAREGAPRDRKGFLGFVKISFSQRRKKLVNVLGNLLGEGGKPEAAALMGEAGTDAGLRPEELSLDDWFRLYGVFEKR